MSMNQLHYSACPVVRDETMKLWERAEIGGTSRMVPFSQRILWLRESETKLRLWHRDAHIKDLVTFNSYYGFLSCAEAAIEEIPKKQKHYQILDGDALAVDFDVTISDVPVMLDESPDGQRWNKDAKRRQYRSVPSYHNGGKWWYTSDKPESDEPYASCPILESKIVAERTRLLQTMGVEGVRKWIAEQRQAAERTEA